MNPFTRRAAQRARIGYLARSFGLAADNLMAAAVVTADGKLVRASESENPDLLWALRGGGGNFGVVTAFTFRLHPVGPVFGGPVFFPGERAADVLSVHRELGAVAPRELSLVAVLMTAPPAPFVPRELWGQQLAGLSAAWIGDPDDGEHALAPLRTVLGRPVMDLLGMLPYTALQQSVDASAPWGMRAYVKSDFLDELDDSAIVELAEAAAGRGHPQSHVLLRRLGGAVADRDGDATAFAHRRATSLSLVLGAWDAGEDPEPERSWARRTWQATRRLAHGTYVNHLEDEGQDRIREAYPAQTWRRLTALKARLDPDNVLRHNQNIPPVAA